MDMLNNSARKLGINLTKHQLDLFEEYYRELADWNQRINLTSVTNYEDVQTTHFLDSLTVIPALKELPMVNIIDVGSGAGFPGIPLRISMPDIKLTLLEATAKKAGFLKHITAKLGLDNVNVVTDRAENLAHDKSYRESFDLVLSRAVAPLATLAEITLPFCKIGGRLVAPKKGYIDQEIAAAERAITTLGGKIREVIQVSPELFADNRCLVIIDKVRNTPDKYPRRPGVPGKNPIS